MNEFDLIGETELGFYFYPAEIKGYPGHPRLDVFLRERPSYEHYDPQKVEYPVAGTGGHIERLAVCHPWRLNRYYRVCAGRIIMSDRAGKMVEAFSFGGDLEIEAGSDMTICKLFSPAPILHLCAPHNLPMWLTTEVEILLACLEARWESGGKRGFEEKLATVYPMTLYACCLQALSEKACNSRLGTGALDREGGRLVHREITRLKVNDRWSEGVCGVEELLKI